jgi:hypothetical protein
MASFQVWPTWAVGILSPLAQEVEVIWVPLGSSVRYSYFDTGKEQLDFRSKLQSP